MCEGDMDCERVLKWNGGVQYLSATAIVSLQ